MTKKVKKEKTKSKESSVEKGKYKRLTAPESKGRAPSAAGASQREQGPPFSTLPGQIWKT